MKIRLMLHDDWELYGDGSGDISELMLNPARQILDICDKFGMKYTFFAEVGQQFAMKTSSIKTHQEAAVAWEKLLINAIQRGHDVQLHLHPQWIGARYEKDRWHLDLTKCSIARLQPQEILSWLQKGSNYLTDLLQPHRSDYKVIAFRGGGYMVQPSTNLLPVLQKIGVQADVSVVPGMKIIDQGFGGVDFTMAPSRTQPWFPDETDVAAEVPSYNNFFCLPVYSSAVSMPLALYSFFINPFSLIYNLKKRRHDRKRNYVPMDQWKKPASSMEKPDTPHKSFFKKKFIFCDFGQVHWSTILKLIDEAIQIGEMNGQTEMPLILYTHSKQFFSSSNFENLAKRLSKKAGIQFDTTQNTVTHYRTKFSGEVKPSPL